MSHRPPTRPARIASKEPPRVRVNWPLTDDELPRHRRSSPESAERFEAPETQPGGASAVDCSAATDALGLFPSEMDVATLFPSETRAPGLPAGSEETAQTQRGLRLDVLAGRPAAPFPVPEPLLAAVSAPPQSRTPGDGAETRDDSEPAYAGSEAVSTSGIAVSPSASALDSEGPRDLAGEIAHLQALIGELTQPIEWRIPGVGGR